MQPPPQPRAIDQPDARTLRIEWRDGAVREYAARQLRLACPCAHCVEEWTGRKLVREEAVAAELTLMKVDLVGRYGLNLVWSDGHGTGIFTWEYLRGLGG